MHGLCGFHVDDEHGLTTVTLIAPNHRAAPPDARNWRNALATKVSKTAAALRRPFSNLPTLPLRPSTTPFSDRLNDSVYFSSCRMIAWR